MFLYDVKVGFMKLEVRVVMFDKFGLWLMDYFVDVGFCIGLVIIEVVWWVECVIVVECKLD